jgi:3-hydroxybutyryl-CoA dehydrogenase
MTSKNSSVIVVVVGAGTMGIGIAQVAVAAGHRTYLVDTNEAQLGRAQAEIHKRLISKGASEKDLRSRLSLHTGLNCAAEERGSASAVQPVVIEAVIEDLDVKRSLLTEAQKIYGPEGIYATNTSSFSVTAIAAGLPYPDRIVGMHFFNPVPVMKLVEVVPGLQTSPELPEFVHALAESWSKTPILAKSTPGFIVNRVARPFYGEALRLAEEGLAAVDVIDGLLREAGTFRMGPFELMDLVGNDVNSTVTRTVWEGHHFDPRFAPSNIQSELVTSGRFGRKTGHGFYNYADGGPKKSRSPRVEADRTLKDESVTAVVTALVRRLGITDGSPGREPGTWDFGGDGQLALTRGRTAAEESADAGVPVVVIDRVLDMSSTSELAYAASEDCTSLEASLVSASAGAGLAMVRVKDIPGLVVARVVSMLINEASEVVHLGLCSARDVDVAMRLGTNYPLGLLEWGDRWGAAYVERIIDALSDQYREPRYRASLYLRQAVRAADALVGELPINRAARAAGIASACAT